MNDSHLLELLQKEMIQEKFTYKKQLAHLRDKQLFQVFQQDLTEEETMLLQFLFAYMPLNDLADYNGDMFLSHIRKTLKIRDAVPWGKDIPDHLFLHFVLPYRVNNENIEDSRDFLFDQLFDRVKTLTLNDAILETNYWCHEKATYTGNDVRTVSPLTLIRTTLGRCGEQSTLAVAALRSLCIPARQCYTPRWAHCDSNHAWVEAWADGQWHFLGACEPEARLNHGWFRAPAKRAMLVNTRVPAQYAGPEEITLQHSWYTEINLLPNYAKNKTITVKIQNQDGSPSDAQVYFQLYNYSEFTTILHKRTDPRGEVSLTTGFGHIYIHATSTNGWNTAIIHPADSDEFTIVLASTEPIPGQIMEFDMDPPPVVSDTEQETITDEEIQRNNERIQEGAQIRAAYEATFVNENQSDQLAAELMLPADRVWALLKQARGNSHEIAAFLQEQTKLHSEWPLKLLESLNKKDLTDTNRPTLTDHLLGTMSLLNQHNEALFSSYILCPRIHFEMLLPFRENFQQAFTQEEQEAYRKQPQALYDRLISEFEVIEDLNHYKGSATPVGSFELKKGDRLSLHIMLSAAARSLGIPARLEPNDQRPQFWSKGSWTDALVETIDDLRDSPVQPDYSPTPKSAVGYCQFIRDTSADNQEAAYYNNFTIARWEEGLFKTLTLPFGKTDVFDQPFEVLSGHYRLTTGTRLPSGTARVRMAFFDIQPGETTEVQLIFRSKEVDIPILGVLDEAVLEANLFSPEIQIGHAVHSHGAVLVWIEPDREPSKHLLRELKELAKEFDNWGGPILLTAGEDKLTASFALDSDSSLPQRATFRKDLAYKGLDALLAPTGAASVREFPIVLAIDSQGRIRYTSSGYKLGIGRELLDVITRY
ncbi:transglutaminase [Paenibacillus baekrokdamisoli]|uniref:Transglutaminase n=1 Tax=Paenibacillus baekrokdamisoli TaxID=1712516 RepID=A0A3G9J9U5_9BACL|nr:transglutaminase domain-containing protein [Paenibacillus baekrokdamisoli]MBB3070003.1 transglutaminase-like putative cysteine protease [Paenibacillus baekrokdamisoli]BBH20648.1 transglutaminase [Paenibacillus baekrokdamisoli]